MDRHGARRGEAPKGEGQRSFARSHGSARFGNVPTRAPWFPVDRTRRRRRGKAPHTSLAPPSSAHICPARSDCLQKLLQRVRLVRVSELIDAGALGSGVDDEAKCHECIKRG